MKKFDNICIIDDDPITVFGIRKMLSLVVTCENLTSYGNGKLALEAIQNNLETNNIMPNVIFLDINMPIMDGWQFLEEFIKIRTKKKVRINIVTSSIDPFDEKNWKKYQKKTSHTITYNHKPIRKDKIAEITTKAE